MLLARAKVGAEVSGRSRLVPEIPGQVVHMTSDDDRMPQDSINERLASAKAIAEALIGVPIVLSQQLVQNIGDFKLGNGTTVEQRVAQLRSLGEMTVRFGTRELSKRIGGFRK